MESRKPIYTLVLDTGAIIKNEPPVSTVLSQSESLATVPEILSEIRDTATRSRVDTTLRPFLTVRSPSPGSIKFVTDFARRTGDLAVLSRPDLQIIALTYEIECERNGGDWRLRRVPGQKRLNGAPPAKADAESSEKDASQLPATSSSEEAVKSSNTGSDLTSDPPVTPEPSDRSRLDVHTTDGEATADGIPTQSEQDLHSNEETCIADESSLSDKQAEGCRGLDNQN